MEIMYDLYNPTILSIDVLRLEKRLDDELLYLRDADPKYSTFPFDMEPEFHPEGAPVPVNPIKVSDLFVTKIVFEYLECLFLVSCCLHAQTLKTIKTSQLRDKLIPCTCFRNAQCILHALEVLHISYSLSK